MNLNTTGPAAGVPYTADPSLNPQATGQAAGGLLVADAATTFDPMVHLAKNLGKAQPGVSAGLTNSNGAPSIDGVTLQFSPEDMAAALLALQNKTQNEQMKNAQQGIQIDQQKMADNNTKQLAKINEWITKCAEAAEKAKAAKSGGWFGKIFGFIAAVISVVVALVATVASGGAAAPLLAMAVVGAVTAGISLGNQVRANMDPPKPPIDSLSSVMGKAMTDMLVAFGVPEEDAKKFGPLMSGLGALLLCPAVLVVDPSFAGQAAGSIAKLSGASDMQVAIVEGTFTALAAITTAIVICVATGGAGAPAAVGSIAKVVDTCSKIGALTAAVLAIGSGAASVASGVLTIEQGHLEKDAAGKLSEKKKIEAMLAQLMASMEEAKQDLKKVLDEIQQGTAVVSEIINSGGESRSQITQNMGQRAV